MSTLLVSALTIGFLGSLHCIGMCGPLASALALTRPRLWWPGLAAYQLGRVGTYVLLGLTAGLAGSTLKGILWFQGVQIALNVFAGLLMAVFALYIGGWLADPFARLSGAVVRLSGMSGWMQRAASGGIAPWLVVGGLNGLLPCGLVYAGLALSLTADSAPQGALTMLAFGLGTVPAMVAAPALIRALTPERRGLILRISAVILLGLAALTMVRPLLHGDHAAHRMDSPAGNLDHRPGPNGQDGQHRHH